MLRLLVLLLVAQWVGAVPMPLRAMAAAGEAVVICSVDGMRTIHLGPDGRPAEPPPADALHCALMCLGPVTGDGLPPPPVLPPPAAVAAADPVMVAAVRALLFLPPPRTQRSRAPPLS